MSLQTQVASGLARLAAAVLSLRALLITRTTAHISNTAPDPAVHDEWFTLSGEHYVWDGAAWFQVISASAPASGGTVTSVGVTVPTGFTVVDSPVTGAGVIGISFAAGYILPTGAQQGTWNTAYGWGNHASAGYQAALVSGTNIKTINGVSVLGSGDLVIAGGGGGGGYEFGLSGLGGL